MDYSRFIVKIIHLNFSLGLGYPSIHDNFCLHFHSCNNSYAPLSEKFYPVLQAGKYIAKLTEKTTRICCITCGKCYCNKCGKLLTLDLKYNVYLAPPSKQISFFKRLTDRYDIVNNIVTAVDAVKFRKVLDRNRIVEHCPGLTPLFLTGNPPPSTRPEYLKRVRTRNFPAREVHLQTSRGALEYKAWLATNIRRGRSLRQFRNRFAMEPRGQEIILDTLDTPFEKSRKIWAAIYQSIGRKLPDFFTKNLEETQMQDSIEDRK